jgi:hypothetical protein
MIASLRRVRQLVRNPQQQPEVRASCASQFFGVLHPAMVIEQSLVSRAGPAGTPTRSSHHQYQPPYGA